MHPHYIVSLFFIVLVENRGIMKIRYTILYYLCSVVIENIVCQGEHCSLARQFQVDDKQQTDSNVC